MKMVERRTWEEFRSIKLLQFAIAREAQAKLAWLLI